MPNVDMLEILLQSKVFKGLSDEHLKEITDCVNIVTFEKNETIIREGQAEHPLFIVIKGQVEVVLPQTASGQDYERVTRIKLNRLTQGDCIGEYSLIDEQPASAAVIALEPCRLFEISRSRFGKIINSNDFIAKTVYKNILLIMIKRARDSNRELDICFH
ncbi:MAG: cyclic nucleotide-binding domain-containing protein [Desulfobacterales bacterium]|uniref:Cyclic nucleotide-binding domain-containing protein n=1 Tax=Candidatus Desulfatibia vada TaxID=2841696 RepID=A0A8J6TKP3_9BACT|nr:cyclic nucleotide-binding domain-containing protein [Candidatus Desulfatibia vada]